MVPGVREYFEKVMDAYISDRYSDIHVLERNVQADHVHVLLDIPPKYRVRRLWATSKPIHSKRSGLTHYHPKLKLNTGLTNICLIM